MRLNYEAVVNDTEITLKGLFRWVGVDCDHKKLIKGVFKQRHLLGAGDHKTLKTSHISMCSVNKGARQFLQSITDDRVAKINELHRRLGCQVTELNHKTK